MTYNKPIHLKCALAMFALLTSVVGCVKRTEVVAVLPDGGVEMVAMLHGDVNDIMGAEGRLANDPPPSAESGWKVSTQLEDKKDSGEQEMTLVAIQSFAPGQPLPTSYASPNTPVADAAKKFYTEVRLEKTKDGTYYHFKRTYPRRVWAPFEYHRERLLETDEIKKLLEEHPANMSDANRKTVADALIAVEVEQEVELLHQAFAQSKGNIPQVAQLKAIGSIREIANDSQLTALTVTLLVKTDAGKYANTLEQDLYDRISKGVRKALVENGTSAADVTEVMKNLESARLRLEISKDLEDESWDVELALPGKIVAHDFQGNPESLDPTDLDEHEPDAEESHLDKAMRTLADRMKPFATKPGFETYSWTFDSRALHDRDVVIMAISFVPNN